MASKNYALQPRLVTRDSVLMFLPSAVVVVVAEFGMLNTLRGTQFDAATSIIAFKRLLM